MGPVYATSSEGASMAPSEPQGRLRGRSPRSKSRESDAPLRARLHPRLRPRQTRARPLTVAAHLRPRPAGGEASVQLDLRRARGEERAEDTDRAVVEAGRHGEDEGLDAVVPREADSIGRRDDHLDGRRARVARAAELGRGHRLARVGERVEEQRLDRALEPARHGEVVAVDPHLAARQLALGEERVARPRGAPEHAPVAEAVGLGLAAVVAQTDERVLAGHQDVAGIDGRRHVAATSTRASLKPAPSEQSASCAGPDGGEMRASAYRDSPGRHAGSRAWYLRSRYADASSTFPEGVFGKTFLKRIASSPATDIASARSVQRRLGRTPPRRGSSGSRASSISSASLARKIGSVRPKRAASRRKISVFGSASPWGRIAGSARWSQCWPYAGRDR